MNDALMKNYDTMVLKDSVSVIHAAFGDTPHVVAMVSVDKNLTDLDVITPSDPFCAMLIRNKPNE